MVGPVINHRWPAEMLLTPCYKIGGHRRIDRTQLLGDGCEKRGKRGSKRGVRGVREVDKRGKEMA